MPDETLIKAVLFATAETGAYGPVTERVPLELIPLCNQPFIGRVVGMLSALEIRDVTVLASHHVDTLSAYLGDGSRWGARIKLISVPSEAQGFARLPGMLGAEWTLVGNAHTLPVLGGDVLRLARDAGGARFVENGAALGWALVRREACGDKARECRTLDEFNALLASAGVRALETPPPVLRSGTPAQLLNASRALLDGRRPEQLIPGASAEAGVHISRNVTIHPTAQVIPPVAIGADCSIERKVRVGPHVTIGEKSIIGEGTELEDAVVFPGTYIGPHLELNKVVVDHNCLAYADASGAVPVPDEFLLSASEGEEIKPAFRRLVRRLFALIVLALLWPVLLIFYLLGLLLAAGKPIRRLDAVRIPAAADPALWRTFRYVEFNVDGRAAWARLVKLCRISRLPTFWNMACGDIGFVGIRPLTPQQLRALPRDWRQMYARGTVGIIRLAELDQRLAGTESDDQTYSSEAYYVATASFKNNLKILWRAIWRR